MNPNYVDSDHWEYRIEGMGMGMVMVVIVDHEDRGTVRMEASHGILVFRVIVVADLVLEDVVQGVVVEDAVWVEMQKDRTREWMDTILEMEAMIQCEDIHIMHQWITTEIPIIHEWGHHHHHRHRIIRVHDEERIRIRIHHMQCEEEEEEEEGEDDVVQECILIMWVHLTGGT